MAAQPADKLPKPGHLRPVEAEPRVHLPQQPGEVHHRGVSLPFDVPSVGNYFSRYPRRWTWDGWAKRLEYEAIIVARSIDSVVWGAVGALLGVGLAGIPGLFMDDYRYLIYQPLGAALGAVAGAWLAGRRWRHVVRSHDDLI